MHASIEPFISSCLIQLFQYKTSNPDMPLLKEHLQRSQNLPIPEGDPLEVEALLIEKEIYRSFLKFFTAASKPKKTMGRYSSQYSS